MIKKCYPDGSTPSICIVGAGFSGLLAGIKLKTELGLPYTIFDENSDVGGTWLVNTYPGCACDVESHLYTYSFEPNPYWSQNYSPQEEILEYLQNIAKKYDLYKDIKFHSQIKRLTWDDSINQWRLSIYNKTTKTMEERLYDLVINSPGALRVPSIPEEFKAFKGRMLHSAEWEKSVEYENKIVGVIGSGSSAIQIIPEIAPKVKELHCYQRKPAWVMPRRQFKFAYFIQLMFAYIPLLLLMYRWMLFLNHELQYFVFLHESKLAKLASRFANRHRKSQLYDDEKLCQQLEPNYRIGCKRIVVSSDYFPTMRRPNVKLHRDPILKVNDHSLATDKGKQEIEVLILATGYTAQDFCKPMEVIGKNSQNVITLWKNTFPRSYFGIVTSVSPNYLMVLGPNSGLGHNTIIFMIECQVNYIVQLINEMLTRNAKVIQVKESAEDKFYNDLYKGMEKTVWGKENCGSWYANAQGVITSLWPWNCLQYWRQTKVPDYTQFNFT